MNINKAELIADEVMIVEFSGGEIPEVTYHGSLYYLCEDPDGPGISLGDDDLEPMKDAVVARYREIILRDLLSENRDKGLYRGLARSMANWRRLAKFCGREKREIEEIREEMARALAAFLHRESADVQSQLRTSCINCSAAELESFFVDLCLAPEALPAEWQCLCEDR